MRTIFLGDIRIVPHVGYGDTPFEVYYGYNAYKFLLEVVSGLHSKLFGETEVMRQFRENFKNEVLPKTSFGEYLRKLRDEIIEDSRKLRSGYLRNLGDQSYGGLAHRLLGKVRKVTVIGTGQLAEQVIPWLLENGREVSVAGRNWERLNLLQTRFPIHTYSLENFPVEEGLVLCAPVPVTELIPDWEKVTIVVDFREKNEGDIFPTTCKYYSFESILELLKENEARNKKLKEKLEIIVSKIVEDREFVSSNNIFCWEDISCIVPLK
ncbi:MAG: glutamyl-tRNA reductase [Leptospiraceae bacterium]|nr:glutamyl-tRNA reductase [Leptospiraceae bacterium]